MDRKKLFASAASLFMLAALISCRMDLITAKLAAPALAEFIAYRTGLDQLVVDDPSPVYPAATALRYTLDGTDPTESSASLTAGQTISTVAPGTTLRVRAYLEGLDPSDVASAAVGDLVQTLATPDLEWCNYISGTIYLTSIFYSPFPDGTVFRYTFDGSDPTESSPSFAKGTSQLSWSAPFTMKAKAYCPGYNASAVGTATDAQM